MGVASTSAPPRRERSAWGIEPGASIGACRRAIAPLGGGRRCEAWLVWDERRARRLVLKLLRPDRAADPAARRALAREAGALARTGHPALVRGAGADPGGPRPWIALEHADGPTLRELIRRGGGLEPARAAALGLALAGALAHLHARGLLHLDVKPSNVVCGDAPVLIDLSAARTPARAARLAGTVGTDAYMAPEQCGRGAGRPIGAHSDVWGVGATLFHALAGVRPFPRPRGARASADPLVRWPQLAGPPPALPAHVPRPLARLVERMLAPAPAARPGLAEVADGLRPLA